MRLRGFGFEFKIYLCNFFISYVPSHTIRLFYYRKVMGFTIGKGSTVHLGCKFNTPDTFLMGENSTINQFCRIDNRGGIAIGNNVSISPYVKLMTADHDMNHPQCAGRQLEIALEDYVFIGADAMLLGGVRMRKGSVLGAKSLLTKSTEPFGIYLGMPAVLKSQRIQNLDYNASYDRLFN